MLRYRCNAGTTAKAIKALKNIKKLGLIHRVVGKRYTTTLKEGYSSVREVVYLYGENGTARFLGFCWGYSGEGPRGLYRLLQLIGLSSEDSEKIAFHTKRLDTFGIDWEIIIQKNGNYKIIS